MRGRLTLCIAMLLAAALSLPALADDYDNSLEDGAWAVQFGIGDNFRLTSFEGSSIALKRHFSDQNALRAVVDAGFSVSESDELSSSSTITRNNDGSVFQINGSLLFQRYLSPADRLSFYWGVGPSFSVRKDDQELTYTPLGGGASEGQERDIREYGVGIDGVLGAEFFLKKRISMHAEYGASGGYVDRKQTDTTTRSDGSVQKFTRDTSNWQGYNGVVRFGLSAYF